MAAHSERTASGKRPASTRVEHPAPTGDGTTNSVAASAAPIVQLTDVGKSYGTVQALSGVSLSISKGEIACILGDNGAGKSTLIKIMSGLHRHDEGTLAVDGEQVRLTSPREALARGIATVYQDLAVVPLMPVWRNFFLGSEARRGFGPIKFLDLRFMRATTQSELAKMGIMLPDVEASIGTLSGGQRQCVAIARAIYFGARVLILDEPTAALGVKQSGMVLKYIAAARDSGLGVVFITHNPHHAHLIGDHFILLDRGRMRLDCRRDEISLEDLTHEMAGGDDLTALIHELER